MHVNELKVKPPPRFIMLMITRGMHISTHTQLFIFFISASHCTKKIDLLTRYGTFDFQLTLGGRKSHPRNIRWIYITLWERQLFPIPQEVLDQPRCCNSDSDDNETLVPAVLRDKMMRVCRGGHEWSQASRWASQGWRLVKSATTSWLILVVDTIVCWCNCCTSFCCKMLPCSQGRRTFWWRTKTNRVCILHVVEGKEWGRCTFPSCLNDHCLLCWIAFNQLQDLKSPRWWDPHWAYSLVTAQQAALAGGFLPSSSVHLPVCVLLNIFLHLPLDAQSWPPNSARIIIQLLVARTHACVFTLSTAGTLHFVEQHTDAFDTCFWLQFNRRMPIFISIEREEVRSGQKAEIARTYVPPLTAFGRHPFLVCRYMFVKKYAKWYTANRHRIGIARAPEKLCEKLLTPCLTYYWRAASHPATLY